MMETKSDWIFFLRLTPKLPGKFFELDHVFKQLGFTLIPIGLDELITINQGQDDFHVISCVSSFSEATYFVKKVNKISKFLLRSKRMHFYVASSFSFINETHLYGAAGNYHYVQLPIGLEKFCGTIAKTIKSKSDNKRKWPGTSRGLGNTIG